jgi:succinate dehydrogenase (ubiquinone) cytochrome b560 subunit
LYVYFSAYAALPLFGHAELLAAPALTDFVATLPAWIKLSLKAPLAAAASFHSFNGLRHLAWDWGYAMSLKGVYNTAYAVLAATAVSTVGLLLI